MQRDAQTRTNTGLRHRGYRDVTGTRSTRRGRKRLLRDYAERADTGGASACSTRRLQMRCRRRGGRKRIVTPDGSELAPATKPQHDGTQDARPRPGAGRSCSMRAGYTPVSEIAEAEGIGFPTIRPIDRAGGATLFVVRS
jgi:hypothetical protein